MLHRVKFIVGPLIEFSLVCLRCVTLFRFAYILKCIEDLSVTDRQRRKHTLAYYFTTLSNLTLILKDYIFFDNGKMHELIFRFFMILLEKES